MDLGFSIAPSPPLLFSRDDTVQSSDDWNTVAACGGPLPDGYPQIWLYCPSFPLAAAASGAFALLFVVHFILAIAYRKGFCWVIMMATLWESAGFGLRAYATKHQLSLTFYSAQNLITTLAPLWINAFVYMVLGRLVDFFIPTKTVGGFYSKFITRTFVGLDIVTFIVQAAGAVMLAIPNNSEANNAGKGTYIAGVGVQLASQLFFFSLGLVFHKHAHRLRRLGQEHRMPGQPGWRFILYPLYLAFVLITARSVYKLLEFTAGLKGPFLSNELYTYALDALPMFVVICLLALFHPGRVFQGPGSEYEKLDRQERHSLRRRVAAEGLGHQKHDSVSEMGLLNAASRPRGNSMPSTAYANPQIPLLEPDPHLRHARFPSMGEQREGLLGPARFEHGRSRSLSPVPYDAYPGY